MRLAQLLSALLAGLLFGSGLILAGMTNPEKVRAFLDLGGKWDPSLALVMAAAIAIAMPAYAWSKRRGTTLAGVPVALSVRRRIDRQLLCGSVVFGIGWGLLGVCPGPGLVAAASGDGGALAFVAAMSAGMLLAGRLSRQ